MRLLARWGSLPLLAAPLSSWALGLGQIETNSYLNQPLNADIPLTATPDELAGLRVSLAPLAEYTARGIDYPATLSSIRLEVRQNAAGENIIHVSSTQSVAEPFVTMLIQVSYGRGSFLREYTMLLDPPLFLPGEAATQPIQEPAAREPAQNVTGGAIERQPAAPPPPARSTPAPAPAPAVAPPVTQTEAPAPAPAPARAAAPAPNGVDYTVQAGDTLWGLTQRYRPSGVTTNQAMMSIFENNPQAFSGNINRLRRGAILRIPPASALGAMGPAAATAEVRRQIEAWQGTQGTGGAPSGDESPRLVLIPPTAEDAAGGATAGAGDSAQVAELEGRVSDLEGELASTRAELEESQRLLELRSEELANLQNQVDNTPPPAEAPPEAEAVEVEAEPAADASAEPAAVEPAPAAAESEPEAQSRPAPAPTPIAPPPPRPSLVDRVLGMVANPIVLIGGAIVVVLLAGLAFLRRRRGELEDVTGQWDALEAELGEETDHAATTELPQRASPSEMQVVESGPGGDAAGAAGTVEIQALEPGLTDDDDLSLPEFEPATIDEPTSESVLADETLSSQTVINLDQADPIAEADFHMAYGLYDQAADLVSKALAEDPDNTTLKLKLLEVYFVWGNKEAFLESAQALKSELGEGGAAEWDKVVIMGKQICPDEPLFSGATAAAGEVDLDLEQSVESSGLDFAFEESGSDEDRLDFDIIDDDLGDDEPGDDEPALRPAGVHESKTPEADDDMLDIGARTQAGLEAALLDDIDEEGGRTTPGAGASAEIDDFEATLESPLFDDDEDEEESGSTIETQAIGASSPLGAATGDTVEQPRPGAHAGTEATAEIELDDLGLDVGDLEDLSDDMDELSLETTGAGPAGETAATAEAADAGYVIDVGDASGVTDVGAAAGEVTDVGDADTGFDITDVGEAAEAGEDDKPAAAAGSAADLLSSTGVTQVLDEDAAVLEDKGAAASGAGEATAADSDEDESFDGATTTGVRTAVLEQQAADFDPEPPTTEADLDLNLDDFSSALGGGADTVEQPRDARFGDVDLDVGADVVADDTPTGTEEYGPLDPQTMTEVGTKLDLARAYIDMGDPDGAKSILEEVLTEGDSSQRTEAQALIDALPA